MGTDRAGHVCMRGEFACIVVQRYNREMLQRLLLHKNANNRAND
jgi:hypothetical protein